MSGWLRWLAGSTFRCNRNFQKQPAHGDQGFLVSGALGYIATFVLIGRVEPDAMIAATFGVIPLAIGLGFFIDHALIRRDARAH